MLPFIKDGDLVTVSPLRDASPHLGDVLAFIHPREKKLFIHRMVGKKGGSYLLRGDSLPEADGLVPKTNFLGKVEKVGRDGKPVFLGLGPERFIIAFLTRRNLFLPLYLTAWKLTGPLLKRFLK